MSADPFAAPANPDASPISAAALVIPFLETLAISGVALSIFSHAGQRATVAASDAVVSRIDELQFELGEGPGFDVMASGDPWQMEPGGGGDGTNPFFVSAVRELDVATIISLPLTLGSVTAGVATLYRRELGLLSAAEMVTAASLVQWAAGPAIQRALISAEREASEGEERGGGLRREVHQATGMILAQLDTTATDAFLQLRAHAFAHGQTVQSVAHQVIARKLNFASRAQ